MSWDIYGNPLRRGYCEVHPDVHQEYPCSICMAEKQQQFQPHDEFEQLKHDFAQQGDYIRKLESEIAGLWQKLRSAQHEVEALQRQDAVHAEVVNILTKERDFLLSKLDENEAQKVKIAELVAQIDRLQSFIKLSAKKWEGVAEVEPTFWTLLRVANESPAQYLRDIQADAVMEAVEFFRPSRDVDIEALESYANNLRRGEA